MRGVRRVEGGRSRGRVDEREGEGVGRMGEEGKTGVRKRLRTRKRGFRTRERRVYKMAWLQRDWEGGKEP